MSNFPEVFQALDHDNKGFILYNDFVNEMQKHLHMGDPNNGLHSEHEATFFKFLNLITRSNEKRIYFDEFINVINKLNMTSDLFSIDKDFNNDDNEHDNTSFQKSAHHNSSPFINDGDNYSTGDSDLDHESRICQDYINTGIGKQNRKRIKTLQNLDQIQSGIIPKRHNSENESLNLDDSDIAGNRVYQNYFSNFPETNLTRNIHNERRKRNYASSDFVTCASTRVNKKHSYRKDDCWTSCSGSVTDLFYNDSMSDIREKLEKLEQSMDNLQTIATQSKKSNCKWIEENQFLKNQIHSLEDNIKQQKKQFEIDFYNEIDLSRKYLHKVEQSRLEDMDILNEKLKTKEKESENLRKELSLALMECEQLKYDNLRAEDKLSDMQQQMSFIEEDLRRLKDFHSRELELVTRERNRSLSNINGPGSEQLNSAALANSQQLTAEISKLIKENQYLKTKLTNCEEEFLALSIQQGKSILESVPVDDSWMTEIDGYSKLEVIDLLIKEKDANYRLREYVTGILTRIIERDPSLLEIT